MSAQAFVLQMVRAHFRRDDSAFAYAANALGRQAKSPSIRTEISDLTRRGFTSTTPARQLGESFRQQPQSQPQKAPRAPANSALRPLAGLTFEELLLPELLQLGLDEIVEELEFRTELVARGLSPRSRLLFHGPPGNGKTSCAAALASALGLEAYVVSIPELVTGTMGTTSKDLSGLFSSIRDDMVIVFDELDAIGSRRGGAGSGYDKEANMIVNTMLMLLDQQQSGVIVATTNRADILDPALLRRFDENMLFPPPSSAQKEALALRLSTKFGIGEVHVNDCENLDEVTKRVKTEARRIVMAELKAADETEEDDGDDGDDAMH